MPLPLAHLYIGEKGRTLSKTYGIKARCYWEHPWGTQWELGGNPLRTWREHVGNKGKTKKTLPPHLHPKLKLPWVHASAYPLAACILDFQNCWSPFLAWANSRGRIKQGRKTKSNSPQPQPPPKRENTRANHECMLSHPIGCMKFLFPKLLVTIFGLG